MLLRLLLLFTVVPFVELMLLLWLAERTGALATIALVLVTGVVGASLARRQGWEVWRRIQFEVAEGRVPGDAWLDALMILVAGALLVTPGILTDAVGFALLIPPVRQRMKRRLADWFKRRATISVQTFGPGGFSTGQNTRSNVIDAEFERRPAEEEADSQR